MFRLYCLRLRGQDTLSNFSAVFYKACNFCDFQSAYLHTATILKKVSTVKGKNLPRQEVKSVLAELPPLKVYLFHLSQSILDTSLNSQMDWFKFYDTYSKGLQ